MRVDGVLEDCSRRDLVEGGVAYRCEGSELRSSPVCFLSPPCLPSLDLYPFHFFSPDTILIERPKSFPNICSYPMGR